MSEKQVNAGDRTATECMRESYSSAREAAHKVVDSAKHKASEYYEQGRIQASECCQKAGNFVKEHPLSSVLIAAGVGLLVGMLIRRR